MASREQKTGDRNSVYSDALQQADDADRELHIFVDAESSRLPFRPLVPWAWAARLSHSRFFWYVVGVAMGGAWTLIIAGVLADPVSVTAAGAILSVFAAIAVVVMLSLFDRTVLWELLKTFEWW